MRVLAYLFVAFAGILLAIGCSKNGSSAEKKNANSCVDEYLVGGERVCARLKDGSYRCRGRNDYLQSTAGSWPHLPRPGVEIAFPGPWEKVVIRQRQTFALRGGKLWYWGDNIRGNFLSDMPNTIAKPLKVDVIPGEVKLFDGGASLCALNTKNELWCQRWGRLGGRLVKIANLPRPVVGLDIGTTQVCAFSREAVHCRDARAFLSEGPHADVTSTDSVFDGDPAKLVSIEGLPQGDPIIRVQISCALLKSGALWCWGVGPEAKGIYPPGTAKRCEKGCPGENFRRARRVDLPLLRDIRGPFGLTHDGRVYVWGGNILRALNRPNAKSPVEATELGSDNQQVLAGASLCVLKQSGSLVCMGENRDRQLQDELCPGHHCGPVEVQFSCEK